MKAALFLVLAGCLLGFVAADESIASDLTSVVGAAQAAVIGQEPESAQKAMTPQECLANCDATDADPNNQDNVNDIKMEMNTVGKEIVEAKAAVKRAEECAQKLEELKAELAELQRQKNEINGDSKQTMLETKKDLEERSATHVDSMIATLDLKLKELQEAEAEMQSKNELTKKALAENPEPSPVVPPVVENEEPQQVMLSDELKNLHDTMVQSLDNHAERVMQMTGDIPGLHDIEYGVRMSKTAQALSDAIDANAGKENIEKTLEKMGLMMEAGVVTPKEKANQQAAAAETAKANAELDAKAGGFKSSREMAKLRRTIKKLKRKLRK